MHEVTQILSVIDQNPRAANQLLPLVYDELRRLAAEKLCHENPGQTLQPTALVHEAYLRLVDVKNAQQWNSRGHFFAAAGEAMRRILVERARRNDQVSRGGGWNRVALDEARLVAELPSAELVALDEALTRLEEHDAVSAQLVKLRYFAGLSMAEAAEALGIPLRTAERNCTFARTWLHRELSNHPESASD